MSNSSDSSCSGNDFDYDAQEKGQVRSGTQVRSGGVTTTSSTNLSSQVNAYPPMTLVEYENETYDPKKPLLLYATKVYESQSSRNL